MSFLKLFYGLVILVFSINTYAEKCHIVPYLFVNNGERGPKIIFDEIVIEVKEISDIGYVKIDDKLRMLSAFKKYVESRESDIDKINKHIKTSEYKSNITSQCLKSPSEVASFRNERFDPNKDNQLHYIKGNWSQFYDSSTKKTVSSSEKSSPDKDSKPTQIILSSTTNSNELTPEQKSEMKSRDAAYKKAEAESAAAAASKNAEREAKNKARNDEHRKICMKPQHRGDCGCLKYFPVDPNRKVCGK